MDDLAERLQDAAGKGMTTAVWAAFKPDDVAVYDPSGVTHTFGKINANANRIVRLLRSHGLVAGDAVALLCSNRGEFNEVMNACQRGGFRLTPVNWHLTTDEVQYIINDCDAKALFAELRYPSAQQAETPNVVVKVAIGGGADGFLPYDETLAALDGSDISDPVQGSSMLYTSGTTGRPKGVFRRATMVGPLPPAILHTGDVQM